MRALRSGHIGETALSAHEFPCRTMVRLGKKVGFLLTPLDYPRQTDLLGQRARAAILALEADGDIGFALVYEIPHISELDDPSGRSHVSDHDLVHIPSWTSIL